MRSEAALGAVLFLSSVLLLQAAHQADVSHITDLPIDAAIQAGAEELDTLAAARQLISFLKTNGAQVHVDIKQTNSHAGLGVFAVQDIKAGDAIVSLPTDTTFVGVAEQGVMDFLLDFVLDLYNANSPRAAIWAATPKPQEMRHLLNFPRQYLPLLQHKELEQWMGQGMHADLGLFCDMHKEVLQAAGISYSEVAHALGLIGTRGFSRPHPDGQGTLHYQLPLIDMANHDNSCPNYNTFGPCDFDANRECVYFTAGADIKAGQEVCNWYGHLLPDRAFLEYGFLLDQPNTQAPTGKTHKAAAAADKPAAASAAAAAAATATADTAASSDAASAPTPATALKRKKRARKNRAAEAQLPAVPLFGIDRHDYDSSEPLVKLVGEPRPFNGNITSIADRIDKLQQLYDNLKAGDALAAEVAAQGPAPGDEGGVFLQQLQQWRMQRQQAVAGEVERLKKLKTVHQIRSALHATHRRR